MSRLLALRLLDDIIMHILLTTEWLKRSLRYFDNSLLSLSFLTMHRETCRQTTIQFKKVLHDIYSHECLLTKPIRFWRWDKDRNANTKRSILLSKISVCSFNTASATVQQQQSGYYHVAAELKKVNDATSSGAEEEQGGSAAAASDLDQNEKSLQACKYLLTVWVTGSQGHIKPIQT